MVGAALGEEAAYDGPFYRLRSPVMRAAEIKVPVVIQGGWYDLFQRGEPLLWESLKDSPDRVLIMSPHYHITKGPGNGKSGPQAGMVQSLAARGEERGSEDAEGEPVLDQR